MSSYSTAQFKLDIYTRVTLELFNKFVEPLVTYTRAHDTISWSLIHVSDALVKCTTCELRIVHYVYNAHMATSESFFH